MRLHPLYFKQNNRNFLWSLNHVLYIKSHRISMVMVLLGGSFMFKKQWSAGLGEANNGIALVFTRARILLRILTQRNYRGKQTNRQRVPVKLKRNNLTICWTRVDFCSLISVFSCLHFCISTTDSVCAVFVEEDTNRE